MVPASNFHLRERPEPQRQDLEEVESEKMSTESEDGDTLMGFAALLQARRQQRREEQEAARLEKKRAKSKMPKPDSGDSPKE